METFKNLKTRTLSYTILMALFFGWTVVEAQNNAGNGEELTIELLDFAYHDENGNGIVESGETVTIDLSVAYSSPQEKAQEVAFSLSSCDPEITTTSVYINVQIPPVQEFKIEDAFTLTVNDDTSPHETALIVKASTDGGTTFCLETVLTLIVNPEGMFIWDAKSNENGYSGTMISSYLKEHGFQFIHTTAYPKSFAGFDAVFLSFGNQGLNADPSELIGQRQAKVISEYLENGGKLYVEGMAIMSIPQLSNWDNQDEFQDLFGVSASIVGITPNPITSLEGQYGTPGQQMQFIQSNQLQNAYIDMITPADGAQIPFIENYYGNVSVCNAGIYGQKTFYLGYSMAELVDNGIFSSRFHLMAKICSKIHLKSRQIRV